MHPEAKATGSREGIKSLMAPPGLVERFSRHCHSSIQQRKPRQLVVAEEFKKFKVGGGRGQR